MFTEIKIPQIITVLFAFVFFLRDVGGDFHVMNIGIPMGLIFILSVFYSFNIKQIFDNNIYILYFLLFITYLYVGTFYSNAPNYGQSKTLGLFMFILIAALSGKYIVLYFDLFLKFNLIFFIFFIIIYITFYGSFGNVLKGLSQEARGEMGGDVFGVISTSRYVGFNLISLFFLFPRFNMNIVYKTIIFSILFLVGLFIMILFGSKGPILALIIAPLIFVLLHKRTGPKKTFILFIALIGISLLLLFPEIFLELIPQKYQAYFQDRFFDYETYASGGRPSLYQLAISDIDQKSLLFGKGTGNYAYLYTRSDTKIYPHNILIELIYENGLIGLILFFGLFRYMYSKTKLTNYFVNKSCLVIYVYYFLFNAQVSGDISNNFALFIFLIFIFYQMKYEKNILNVFNFEIFLNNKPTNAIARIQ